MSEVVKCIRGCDAWGGMEIIRSIFQWSEWEKKRIILRWNRRHRGRAEQQSKKKIIIYMIRCIHYFNWPNNYIVRICIIDEVTRKIGIYIEKCVQQQQLWHWQYISCLYETTSGFFFVCCFSSFFNGFLYLFIIKYPFHSGQMQRFL